MKELLNVASIIALVLSGVMIYNSIRIIRKENVRWGKAIFFSFILGLLICIIVAFRDRYGFSNDSLISMDSMLSSILSLLGLTLAFFSLAAIFVKNLKFRRFVFFLISFVFVSKFLIVEIYRLISLI